MPSKSVATAAPSRTPLLAHESRCCSIVLGRLGELFATARINRVMQAGIIVSGYAGGSGVGVWMRGGDGYGASACRTTT